MKCRDFSKIALRSTLVAFLIGMMTPPAWAAVSCTETVTTVIVHTDGDIYFQTSVTCSQWCQASGTGTLLQNEYALLLTAYTTGAPVAFNWPNLTACTAGGNATYAEPTLMELSN